MRCLGAKSRDADPTDRAQWPALWADPNSRPSAFRGPSSRISHDNGETPRDIGEVRGCDDARADHHQHRCQARLPDRLAHQQYPSEQSIREIAGTITSSTLGISRRQFDAPERIDFALVRSIPHLVIRRGYNDQRWPVSSVLPRGGQKALMFFGDSAFLRLLAQKSSASCEGSGYQYLHVMTTHRPMVVREGCGYAGGLLCDSR